MEKLYQTQTRRGITDEVSLDALDRRWRHLLYLPDPTKSLPPPLMVVLEREEEKRKAAVAAATV